MAEDTACPPKLPLWRQPKKSCGVLASFDSLPSSLQRTPPFFWAGCRPPCTTQTSTTLLRKKKRKRSSENPPEQHAAAAARPCRSALNQVKPQAKPQLQRGRRAPDPERSSALKLGGVQQLRDPLQRFRGAFIRDAEPIRVKTVRLGFFLVLLFPLNSFGKRRRSRRASAPCPRRRSQAGGRAQALAQKQKPGNRLFSV